MVARTIPAPENDRPRRRRRWIPLSLRVFVAILLFGNIAVTLPVAIRAHVRCRAVSRIEEKGGFVHFRGSPGLVGRIKESCGDWGRCWQRVYQIDVIGDRFTDDDLKSLQDLSDVQTINIRSDRVSDDGMTWLAGIGGLKNLSLPHHIGDEGIRRLSKSKTIRSLDLGSNSAITDAAGESVARMTDLEELFLSSEDASNSKIGDDFVGHLRGLRHLRYLDLFGTNVSDEGLIELRKCLSLESVDLTWTLVSESGIEEFRRALPNARVRWASRPWDE